MKPGNSSPLANSQLRCFTEKKQTSSNVPRTTETQCIQANKGDFNLSRMRKEDLSVVD